MLHRTSEILLQCMRKICLSMILVIRVVWKLLDSSSATRFHFTSCFKCYNLSVITYCCSAQCHISLLISATDIMSSRNNHFCFNNEGIKHKTNAIWILLLTVKLASTVRHFQVVCSYQNALKQSITAVYKIPWNRVETRLLHFLCLIQLIQIRQIS